MSDCFVAIFSAVVAITENQLLAVQMNPKIDTVEKSNVRQSIRSRTGQSAICIIVSAHVLRLMFVGLAGCGGISWKFLCMLT